MSTSGSPGLPGPVPAWQPRRAYRSGDDGILGGVAAGLAQHLGLTVNQVRLGFVAASALAGFGAVLYAALWIVLPHEPEPTPSAPGLAAATRDGRRPARSRRVRDAGPLVALAAILLGLAVWLQPRVGSGLLVPLALGVLGLFALWRQADEAQRDGWGDLSGRVDPLRTLLGSGGWASVARLATGGGLLLAALLVFAAGSGNLELAQDVVVAAGLGVVGLALVVGPWVVRLARDLSTERTARVRSQERADMAAHLHDSVLQTLALIQKSAHDPATVSRLARSQERDLRGWLFETDPTDPGTLAGAVRRAAAEVEDRHGVPVEVVAVGDAAHDDTSRALVLAAREAMTNAARHSGAGHLDVYLEVTGGTAEVFVRDRGRGFDPDTVADDRHGLADSIHDRMRRHGGESLVRSAPGEGTEVRLRTAVRRDAEEAR